MNNNSLSLKNKINPKNLKNRSLGKLNKKFEKVFIAIKKEIKNDNRTLNILDNKFTFNFKIKNLKKFKKFKTIAVVGMGGSILGIEAIYNFLK